MKVVGRSQEWLDEEFDAYLVHNLPLRPGFERRHSPSAAVREIDPDQDAESVIRYSTKLWSSQGKSEYLLLSGFHSLQA